MTTSVQSAVEPRRLVRVWFGTQPICEYLGEPAAAERYERAMRRRYRGLRVTNEAAPSTPAGR